MIVEAVLDAATFTHAPALQMYSGSLQTGIRMAGLLIKFSDFLK